MADKLTPEQSQAVHDRGGRLLVSAAAGSGKTKVLVDRLLFRLWGCRMVGDKDFRKYSNGFLLTDCARQKILQEWDQELRQTVLCPTLNRAVSYRQLLRLDCYKLVNYLLEGREYKPYRIDY